MTAPTPVKKVVGGRGRFQNVGPVTYLAGAAITAGQVCQAGSGGTAGKVIPAGLNAAAMGVACTPAVAAGVSRDFTETPTGFPIFASDIPDTEVALDRTGARYLLAGGTIAWGDFVKCGAAGTVVKWDPATDQANPQLGQCIDIDGATNGQPVLIDINIQG